MMNISSDFSDNNLTASSAQPPSKLKNAAQEFEAMLLQEMLKPLRSKEDSWSGDEKADSASDTINGFGCEAVARAISARGGLGIAKQVIRQVAAEQQKET